MSFTAHPAHVLLVDDDPAQARMLALVLRRALGETFQLETTTDSANAKERIRTGWVDILITDLIMPEINGLELLRLVKERNRCSQVLVMTAFSTSDTLLQAMETGASDFLLKPLDQRLLVELVEQAASRLHRWHCALAGTFKRKREEHVSSALPLPQPS